MILKINKSISYNQILSNVATAKFDAIKSNADIIKQKSVRLKFC